MGFKNKKTKIQPSPVGKHYVIVFFFCKKVSLTNQWDKTDYVFSIKCHYSDY